MIVSIESASAFKSTLSLESDLTSIKKHIPGKCFKSTLSLESDSNSAQFCHRLLIKINNPNRQICINKISSPHFHSSHTFFCALFQVRISLPFYVYFLFAPLFILFKDFLSWVSLHFMRILHQSNL